MNFTRVDRIWSGGYPWVRVLLPYVELLLQTTTELRSSIERVSVKSSIVFSILRLVKSSPVMIFTDSIVNETLSSQR
ncbi:unnamed protein product [Linum trigynum]|uniref:Uncharacterized protein n=1 Tax=Linum trigynum TaxID=586398 RepID=A0AAV2GNF8_9ROSI